MMNTTERNVRPETSDGNKGMPAVRARQGVISGRVVTVLVVSVVLVIVALFVSYLATR
jgi:hypothetical protein